MIHQSLSELQSESEVALSRLTFSPTADCIKHSNRDVSEHIISNKLINEASDSDYTRIDNFGLKTPLCVNDLICNSESEFLIDENTRLSFGALNEVHDSTIDMDTSNMSFSREKFGKYIIRFFLPNISFQLLC